jgi:hypothetical protein
MAKELKAIDVTHRPELLRLAEEVRRTNEPRLLRRDGEDLAVVAPVAPTPKRRRARAKTEADHGAFLASAGSWKDVDVDRFLAENDERRRLSTRPPVES